MIGTIGIGIIIVSMLSINMFALFFTSRMLLDMRDRFNETQNSSSQTEAEFQNAYNKGTIVGWQMITYTLKMMEDQGDILDHVSLIDGIERTISKIPSEITKKISQGIDPLKEDEDDNGLY